MRRIAIYVGDDYEDLELQVPKYRLLEAGFDVVIAGLEAGVMHHGKHGYPQMAHAAVRDLNPADFAGLVVPGGWMPDKLRRAAEVKKFTAAIAAAGKPIASICHGPWIDISSGIVKGVTYTSTPALTDDLTNAGATWVDQPVCVDAKHRRVSSRRPDDLPMFCSEFLKMLG